MQRDTVFVNDVNPLFTKQISGLPHKHGVATGIQANDFMTDSCCSLLLCPTDLPQIEAQKTWRKREKQNPVLCRNDSLAAEPHSKLIIAETSSHATYVVLFRHT